MSLLCLCTAGELYCFKLVIPVRFFSRAGNATDQISLRCRRERAWIDFSGRGRIFSQSEGRSP